jgi:RimJ/RimL family protein N-acetyltransferase
VSDSSASGDVRLRPTTPGDLPVFFEQQRDPEAVRRANFPARAWKPFVDHWQRRVLGDDGVLVRTVTVDGRTAGNVVAWLQDGRRSVGYWFGREFWGRGVGTRALTQFLEVELTRPLYADTDVGNTASIRLLERCGFRHVETIKTPEVEYVLLRLQ